MNQEREHFTDHSLLDLQSMTSTFSITHSLISSLFSSSIQLLNLLNQLQLNILAQEPYPELQQRYHQDGEVEPIVVETIVELPLQIQPLVPTIQTKSVPLVLVVEYLPFVRFVKEIQVLVEVDLVDQRLEESNTIKKMKMMKMREMKMNPKVRQISILVEKDLV